jgi:hypothetical protein
MGVEESLWSLRLPNGDVRSGTIEQLQEAFRAGHLAGNSPVLPPGAREWVTLDTIAVHGHPLSVKPPPAAQVAPPPEVAAVRPSASPPPAASQPPQARGQANGDIWQVRLGSGEVRSGTRQQLDEAFRAGHIDGSALALPAGARDWTRLDSVLQTRDVAAAPTLVSPSQAPTVVAPQSLAASPAAAMPQAVPQPVTQRALERVDDVDDICHVKVPRAQLEEAFRAGFLDESILVLTSEASDWVKLGSLVDRGSAPSSTSRQAAVSQTGEWPPSEAGGLAKGDPPLPAPQTEPVLDASSQEERGSRATDSENGLAGAKGPDDDTPSMPGLT